MQNDSETTIEWRVDPCVDHLISAWVGVSIGGFVFWLILTLPGWHWIVTLVLVSPFFVLSILLFMATVGDKRERITLTDNEIAIRRVFPYFLLATDNESLYSYVELFSYWGKRIVVEKVDVEKIFTVIELEKGRVILKRRRMSEEICIAVGNVPEIETIVEICNG